ncbi:hypothetical protein F5884DRAFT_512708 [Xylogone sp. PMI_703]|nr:hypothetical protein F5884DRAFT_512708 [Xylogone sp. PMI_703]
MLVNKLPETGLLAIHWSFCGVALLFVLGRTYIHLSVRRRLSLDDYFIYAAWTVLLINTILQTLQNHSTYIISLGFQGLVPADQEFVTQGNIYVRYEFVSIGLFWTVTWLVKASFLTFYWQLLESLREYRRIWYGVSIFTFLAYIGCWIASLLNCLPVTDYWKFGKCNSPGDQRRATIAISYSTFVDVLTDLMIMAIPLLIVTKIRISGAQRLGLIGVFSLAFITIAIAIVRCVQAINNERELVFLAVWSTIESSVSVIVGCLPPFKTFLGHRLRSLSNESPAVMQRAWPYNQSGAIALESEMLNTARIPSDRLRVNKCPAASESAIEIMNAASSNPSNSDLDIRGTNSTRM